MCAFHPEISSIFLVRVSSFFAYFYVVCTFGLSFPQDPYNLLVCLTAAKLAAAQGVSTLPGTPVPAPSAASPKESSDGEADPPQAASVETAVTNGDATGEPESDNEKDEKMVVEEEEARKKREEEEERAKELQKAQDKSKPVSSTPVPGTPW